MIGYQTIHTTFTTVKHKECKSGKCAKCGKRTKRQCTFEATINPFNKNADGVPKSYGEVLQDVKAQGAEWSRKPILCAGCE